MSEEINVLLVTGASHTGKTNFSCHLMGKLSMPYLSIDWLKMGLIRSGMCPYNVSEDERLTQYLWPVVRNMMMTVVENRQKLIIEGCYVPSSWRNDFDSRYLSHIRGITLIMSEDYIRRHERQIRDFASCSEKRICDDVDTDRLIEDNLRLLEEAKRFSAPYLLIDDEYPSASHMAQIFCGDLM